LKLNKFVSNKNAIQNAFSFLERAQNLAKIAYNNFQNESKICDDSKSNAIKKNAKNTLRYTKKVVKKKNDSELEKIENKETKKILK